MRQAIVFFPKAAATHPYELEENMIRKSSTASNRRKARCVVTQLKAVCSSLGRTIGLTLAENLVDCLEVGDPSEEDRDEMVHRPSNWLLKADKIKTRHFPFGKHRVFFYSYEVRNRNLLHPWLQTHPWGSCSPPGRRSHGWSIRSKCRSWR